MQTVINIISNIFVIILNFIFNVSITPVYIHKLGLGVYGYIGVITNFISFLSIITIILNSMVGRFYSVSLNRGQREEANKYINTALFVGIGLDLLLLPIILFLTFDLQDFIVITSPYIGDVKLAFLLTAIAFLINVISLVNMTGAYALNRLEINNVIRLIMIGIRFIVILLLFYLFQAKIYFLGISLIIENLFALVVTYITFKKLVPDLRYDIHFFSKSKMYNLISSGFFCAVVLLGDLLMSQVLLIVANHTISAIEVGVLSSIIIIVNALKSIAGAISSAFSPMTLKLYAQGQFEKLMENTTLAIMVIGVLTGWISSIFCVLSTRFFSLWLQEDFSEYHMVIVIFVLPMISILATGQFHVVLQALNRLFSYSLVTIGGGIISIAIMYFLGVCKGLGLLGLVAGCNAMAFIQHVIVLPGFVYHYLHCRLGKMYISLLISQAYGIAFYLIVTYFCGEETAGGIVRFILEGIILSVLYFGGLFVLIPKQYKLILLRQMVALKQKIANTGK